MMNTDKITVAVMSDIHGNYVALESCISYALSKGAKTFLFLGDYLGELAYPQKTMSILYSLAQEYKCYFIKGNKEDYWINYEAKGENGWKEYDSTTGSLFYTYYQLTEKDKKFFKSLSHKASIYIDDFPPLTICHGSPNDTRQKLLPGDENTLKIMEASETSFVLCGHSHVQGIITHKDKTVINAGAVGVAAFSEGRAQFALLQGCQNTWTYELISLDYDVEQVIADLYTSGLTEKAPCWCKVTEHLLRTGKVMHASVLERAMKLCHQATGSCKWPDIPEEYWKQAVAEML